MAGFAVLMAPGSDPQTIEADFNQFLRLTAQFKELEIPANRATGRDCLAAKLDSPATLHPGIIYDLPTGSWLLAVGTVVALGGNNDPQVLLQDLLREYLRIGSKALERFDGHFALAIYDCQNERLSIISDPMGNFSIYYGSRGNHTFISTSALAIASLVKSETDVLAMESYLRTSIVHGERTFWKDVKRILPASIHAFSRNTMEVSSYWALTYNENIAKLPLTEAIECADEMIKTNLSLILDREGTVLADLTGGFDTRITTMYMAKQNIPFIAYSVGPEDHPDVVIPRLISQTMGWEYHHMPLPDHWEQTQFEWFRTALYKGDARLGVASLARVLYGHQMRSSICKTNVMGLGVDEWREVFSSNALLFNWRKTFVFDRLLDKGIFSAIPASVMRENRETQVRDEWKTYLSGMVANYPQFSNNFKSHIMFVRHRYPSHGGAYLSASSGVMRSISPFCFKEPVNFALSLPYEWRLSYHHKFIRSLLEKVNPALANIETEKGGPAVPIRIRNLHRFWPLWSALLDKGLNRVSKKVLRKSIHIRKPSHAIGYPLPSWQKALVKNANADGFFTPSKMYSGSLYQAEALQLFAAQAETAQSTDWSFLERVMTIEMAMRVVGTPIN